MTDKRYCVIGDAHGCRDELEELIDNIKYDQNNDTLVSLGDIVDRGPAPAECFQLLMRKQATMVRANHEDRLLRWRKKERAIAEGDKKKNDIHLSPVHQASMDDLNNHPNAQNIWKYIEEAPLFYHFEVMGKKYAVCHAGIHPTFRFNTDPKLVMRIRNLHPETLNPITYKAGKEESGIYWADLYDGPETIIFGHNVFEEPTVFPFARGIDCGAVYGGSLIALIVNPDGTEEFKSVKAKKIYYSKDKGDNNRPE